MTVPDTNSLPSSPGSPRRGGRLDGLLGGKAPRLRGRTPLEPSALFLSVLVPVYNERATIETIIAQVRDAVDVQTQIICVDDFSTDGTRDILARLKQEGRIDVLILHERNKGKGAAIRTALAASTGNVVIVQDADLEYDPADWPALLQPIIDGKADAVFGSRFLGGPHRPVLLAHGREQDVHAHEQHLHEPQPHRHGDLLQGDPR